jgi:valyl-tRNA synthetase
MSLSKRYRPEVSEPALMKRWQENGTYQFQPDSVEPSFTIDTPPPTVSGRLHMGHVYSYSHADFLARFWRMNSRNVLYPMGYDDNGLPTERLVERWLNIRAAEVGRQTFIKKCLEISVEAEKDYETLWKRLGLSIDWRYTYRTIDDGSRRLSQLSFIDLYEKGLAYRKRSPTIWCPECGTAIAQAELDDMDRSSEFVTLKFQLDDGTALPIATTRPELLPACVAVFVHPEDSRYMHLLGRQAHVPFFGQAVPILEDPEADPEKGTGAVMCCTFGDTTDVAWWFKYDLELIEAVGRDGMMTGEAGAFEGLALEEARNKIKVALEDGDFLLGREPTEQSIRVHERCDTPVEYVVASQWFIRVLEYKEQLIEAASKVSWYPAHMQARFRQWVENLNWDWCISRQRYFGVTFPVWYCRDCGAVHLAERGELPVDPTATTPNSQCSCGSSHFNPEEDVMDTWATSSLTPQIVAGWLDQSGFGGQTFSPISVRPQAHDIIRTWAFYSIVKAYHHFGEIPWHEAAISGWGLAAHGAGKISKSRGGGSAPPLEMLDKYSADAVRYWAASTALGKDAIISDEKIKAGSKLITKLWNVARFSSRFFTTDSPWETPPPLSAADRWILSRLQQLITRVTESFVKYDYATAKNETEVFFWNDLADNYLEMAKRRLYDEDDSGRNGAVFTLHYALLSVLKLFAPFLPHVTEEIYSQLYAAEEGYSSIHRSPWPLVQAEFINEQAEETGAILVLIATAVRRYKSNAGLSLGAELSRLVISAPSSMQRDEIRLAESDLLSITRASELKIVEDSLPESHILEVIGSIHVSVQA